MYSKWVSIDEHVPTRRRQTRRESQQETRARLIAAAIDLFADAGVSATSLHAVAEHAGYSRGAVHGNFADKGELARAVADAVAGELAPELDRILRADGPSGERLAGYIRAFIGYCAEQPRGARALVAVVTHLGRGDAGFYEERVASSLDGLVGLFEEGQRRGEMRDFDPRIMAFGLRTVLDAAAARRGGEAPAHLAEELVGLFDAATCAGALPATGVR